MHFVKMHALGNDYVYVDGFKEKIADPSALSRRISNRHTGVGSDGLILVMPSERAVCRMEMYNSDGSPSDMCGNGMRCMAKYVYEECYTDELEFDIETPVGIHHQWVKVIKGEVYSVISTLGRPKFGHDDIPMLGSRSPIAYQLQLEDRQLTATSLSVGNPHTVIFVEKVDTYPCEHIGAEIENHDLFPERTNVEFVQVLSPDRIRMRVWERGAGITLSCGSGATAAVVAVVETGKTERKVTVELALGEMEIEYPQDADILMTGPVTKVFEGEWE